MMIGKRVFVVGSMMTAAILGAGPGAPSTAHAELSTAPLKVGTKSAIELKPAIVAYGDTATLRASVFQGEGGNRAPVADGDVEFRVNGKVWGSAKTDASGVAALKVTPTGIVPGSGPVKTTARFLGKGGVVGSTDDATLAVIKGASTWTSPHAEEGPSMVDLKGWLESAGRGVGPYKPVTVSLNGKTLKSIDDWNGLALPYSAFAAGQNKIRLQFEGNEYYTPASTEFSFFRKRDTKLYFESSLQQVAFGKSFKIRVRVGVGATDSPTATMFVPGRSVTVKLVEEHPYYKTKAYVGYKVVEHTAVTDATGWATFVTSSDWVDVGNRTPSMAGRQLTHKIKIAIADAQWRAEPQASHVQSVTVAR